MNLLRGFLNRAGEHLVLFGFIMGARWVSGNAIETSKAIRGFEKTFDLDPDEKRWAQAQYRMEQEFFDLQKTPSKPGTSDI